MSPLSAHSPTQKSPISQQDEPAVYELTCGASPLVISAPHTGHIIPSALQAHFTPEALKSEDSDWFIKELYAPIAERLGGSLLSACLSRYVVDLNRPASDESLYPGQRTTGLCPTESFGGARLYREGCEPSAEERAERVQRYWRPYHEALRAELERVKAQHGYVLLWEAHSIKSEVPLLFEGRLPEVNLGTFEGRSCPPEVASALQETCAAWPARPQGGPGWRWVLNGRFKGGYITRHFGDPAQQVHATQLELSQRAYLADEGEPVWDERSEACAERARPWLEGLISAALSALAERHQGRAL
jgi:N-formylglutamate deformylase